MTQMITLFGKEPKQMNRTEIRRELKAQKALLRAVKRAREVARYKHEKRGFDFDAAEKEIKDIRWLYVSWQMERSEYLKRSRYLRNEISHATSREDVIELYDIYITNIEALIAELEFYKDRRQESSETVLTTYARRKNAEAIHAKLVSDNNARMLYNKASARDGISVTWDRDKFTLIANDRGYRTESSIILAIQEELGVERAKAQLMYNKGRFTWGQVLCLGVKMEMTPKEFCDTFLSGYFIDCYGEYKASYANVNKEELLRRAIYPDERKEEPKKEPEEPKEIETDASGKPMDEEIWFDD